jgi:hypothetical protein
VQPTTPLSSNSQLTSISPLIPFTIQFPEKLIIHLFQLLGETSKDAASFGRVNRSIHQIHQTSYVKILGDYWFAVEKQKSCKSIVDFPIKKAQKQWGTYYDFQALENLKKMFPNRESRLLLIKENSCSETDKVSHELIHDVLEEVAWEPNQVCFLTQNITVKGIANDALKCLSLLENEEKISFTLDELKNTPWEILNLAKKKVETLNVDRLDQIIEKNFTILEQLPLTPRYQALITALQFNGKEYHDYFLTKAKQLGPKASSDHLIIQQIWKNILVDLKTNPVNLKKLSENIRSSRAWMEQALPVHPKTIIYFKDFHENTDEFFTWVLQINGLCLAHLKPIQDSKHLVQIAIEQNKDALQFASQAIKKTYKITAPELYSSAKQQEILNRIKLNAEAFTELKSEKKENHHFVIQAIQTNRDLLIKKHVSDVLLDQKEFVLKMPVNKEREFVESMGHFFKDASDRLKQDLETIEQAIKIHPLSYCYTNQMHQNNENMSLLAIKMLKNFAHHIRDILKVIPLAQLSNPSFIRRAMHVNAKIIPYLISKIPLNAELIDEMIKVDGMSIENLTKELGQENLTREQYVEAVRNNPFAYYKIPKGFQSDPEILALVRSHLSEEA